jgi:polyphosphate:AMP phosphotransferase
MFKAAEAGHALSDTGFRELKDQLRLDLVELQQRSRLKDGFPTIILLAGVQGAGVMDTLNLLNTWMDPRWIHTHAFDAPSDEERERPPFWRYWRTLPAAGNIGLYLDGWYSEAITPRSQKRFSAATFKENLRRIAAFERTLADDGALIFKVWLHISKADQRRKPDEHRIDPVFGFRASDAAWPQPAPYDAFTAAAAESIRATNQPHARWHIINGADDNARRATVLTLLRDALKEHQKKLCKTAKQTAKRIKAERKADKKSTASRTSRNNALAKVDLKKSMSDTAYARAFRTRQTRLYDLQKEARNAKLSSVIAFEGWDAAGKGGAIRRLTYALSARNYQVAPIAAPNDDERAHHYLWRFWQHLSRAGRMTIFDRSWYGRVLVERVEHLITSQAWERSYAEINEFEKQLDAHDVVVLKFWLHIDADEQLRRFKDREETPYKRWKITDDDWRNREKWSRYEIAVNEMIARTSTPAASWHLIPANDKRIARIMILDRVIKALENGLARQKGRKGK